MKTLWAVMLGLGVAWAVRAQTNSLASVRVIRDHVNLRAKPQTNAEVVGQMSENDILAVKTMDKDWVEVVAPPAIDLWIHSDFVKDGTITAPRVNVRANAGINFSSVGQLQQGGSVTVRGTHDKWVKIAPPESCSLWVSRSLVELLSPRIIRESKGETAKTESRMESPKPVPPGMADLPPVRQAVLPVSRGGSQPAPVVPSPEKHDRVELAPSPPRQEALPPVEPAEKTVTRTGAAPAIAPPADVKLIAGVGQGQWKQVEGVLKQTGYFFRRPSRYRLVVIDSEGETRMLCYVKGNRDQMNALLGRTLAIGGREYWVEGKRHPMIVPEQIQIVVK
ncbi:MAG: SH3 domain-containing protein [Lentisphaerae bacterium]|nr:SH3 domain-containing protein [Lentisphaerota bacterium]